MVRFHGPFSHQMRRLGVASFGRPCFSIVLRAAIRGMFPQPFEMRSTVARSAVLAGGRSPPAVLPPLTRPTICSIRVGVFCSSLASVNLSG